MVNIVNKANQARVAIPTEPAFIALGPIHIAVGMNNKVSCSPLKAIPSA